MSDLNELPELVRNSKLEATLLVCKTIHPRLRGRQGTGTKEVWAHLRSIGHGAYGQVWKEQLLDSCGRRTANFRAVKRINTSSATPRDYIRELEALAKFSSNPRKYAEFFVEFHGWYERPGRLYIAMEYCSRGDLGHYLQDYHKLTEKATQEITVQVMAGLSLMHEAGFAHRDVKPANILIKSAPPQAWWVKLGDLGLSKRAEIVAGSSCAKGTPGFIPPEILGLYDRNTTKPNAFSGDIWSLGETLHRALTGEGTFESNEMLMGYVKGSVYFPGLALMDAGVSGNGISFVYSLMSPDPSLRPSAKHALKHPWMNFEENSSLDVADDLANLRLGLKPIDFSGTIESSEASGIFSDERKASTAGNRGHQRRGMPTSMEDTLVGPNDLSDRTITLGAINRATGQMKHKAGAKRIGTARMEPTMIRI